MRRQLIALSLAVSALPLLAATEPNPSAKQRAEIEKLLTATNIDAGARSMMDAMYGQIEKQFLGAASSNDSEDVAEAREMFAEFRKRAAALDFGSELHEAYVRLYAKYFTEQELADLNAFYASTTGKKAIEMMPALMRDGMEIGVQHITPKIEKLMSEVMADQAKKKPWKQTMSDMTSVATALEAYATDHKDTYPAGDYASLKAALAPTYITTFPDTDSWGHAFGYAVSPDRKHYRIISGGADTNFEWDSARIVLAKEGEDLSLVYKDRLEDDLIYADGQFIQLPVQAKPKTQK